MKTLLVALTMIPAMAQAQNYIAKENNGRLNVYPTKGTVSFNRIQNANSCENLRMTLSYDDVAAPKPEDRQELIDTLDSQTVGDEWGSPYMMIPMHFEGMPVDSVAAQAAHDYGKETSYINVIEPDFGKSRFSNEIIVKNPNNIFIKAMNKYKKTFKHMHVNYNGMDYVRINGRLANCAFYENAVTLKMKFENEYSLRVETPSVVVDTLHSYYTDVASAWAKEDEKKWDNELHKLLKIGVVLKEKGNSKKITELMNMTQAFDKFFTTYWKADGDDGLSVYFNKFKNMAEFKSKVAPDKVTVVEVSGILTEN
jgi:hypothetical protein